ncbi:MAG: carboxypeptidase regulatory-like domain-containing protein [Lacunisphaera sp.]|nr:carboxypeptidase regulatory-like domain-containing protein [Lacunisphaera sp.]
MDFKKCPRVLEPRFLPLAWALAALLVAGLGGCGKSPEEVKAAKAVEVAQTTGSLVVKSNRANTTVDATLLAPPGAAAPAVVKGTDEGAAEQTLAALPPGKYAVTARSAGWPEVQTEATVEAGRTTDLAVTFKGGSLRLASEPSGATVKQGNAVLGKTPLVLPSLPPGECKLTLEYPSWPVVSLQTTITVDGETTETVRLPHGKLTVESTPSGATVLLGGKPAGQTPLRLERFPAGTRKLTLQGKDFPPLEISVTIEDRGDVKVSPQLGSGFPLLEPEAVLRAVWVPHDPNRLAPPVDGTTGPSQPRNGIIKNLNRKRLYETWLRKTYRFSAVVKSYEPKSGQVEFVEEQCALSKYRVLANLSVEAQGGTDLAPLLTKGATFTLYGRLSAVEEPRWPGKVITFEFSAAEPLR